MKLKIATAIAAVLISVSALSSEPEKPPVDAPNAWERYRVLSSRNIFSKTRGQPAAMQIKKSSESKVADGDKEKKDVSATRVELDFVLNGIVAKDGELTAFLENRKAGTLSTAKSGDPVAAGKLTAIMLDGVQYESNGTQTLVGIGKALDGSIPLPKADTPKSSTTGTTDARPDSGSSSENAILERMRKKRQEEMK